MSTVSINFNAPAMMNVNRLNTLEKGLMRSMQRVASGERVTRPADDVAAHGVGERLKGQIRGLNMASRNVQDGIALINCAEAALNEVHDILHRMRELAVQAANGTSTDDDRLYIQIEIDKLKDEINATSRNTHYNNLQLLDGTGDWGEGKGGFFQIGANSVPNTDFIRHKIPAVNTATLGFDRVMGFDEDGEEIKAPSGGRVMGFDEDGNVVEARNELRVDTQDAAQDAIDRVISAVDYLDSVRASLGGVANRLEHAWMNVNRIAEDNQAYESIVMDTDVAAEMITITRDQIISQYCSAMLAQANQTPQTILQLLSRR
jgi:flagellin